MRTNIEIDDKLLQEAMALTGAKTKKEAVNDALLEQVRRRRAVKGLLSLQGKIDWVGDLDAMRREK